MIINKIEPKITVYMPLAILLILLSVITISTFNKKKIDVCPKCNLIIIDIDALRQDVLDCADLGINMFPSICGFIRKGVYFSNNYSLSQLTLTSIMSTITSSYPADHGVDRERGPSLSEKIITIAEEFKKNGYSTYWAGPYGFWTLSKENGGLRGYDVLWNDVGDIGSWSGKLKRINLEAKQPFYIHFYSTQLELPFLFSLQDADKIRKEKLCSESFPLTEQEFKLSLGEFLIVNIKNVFTPFAIEENNEIFTIENKSLLKQRIIDFFYNQPSGSSYIYDKWHTKLEIYRLLYANSKDSTANCLKSLYKKKVQILDDNLLKLFSELNNSNTSTNTIIVLMSDRGIEFFEHGSLGHNNNPHDELLSVPLAIYFPKVKPLIVSRKSQNIDIFPTISNLVGISLSHRNIKGESLNYFLKKI